MILNFHLKATSSQRGVALSMLRDVTALGLEMAKFDLENSIKEIERVGKQGYIMVESYRNNQELFNLQCWALTAESFFDNEEWIWLFKKFCYTGDYEFIHF